MKVYLHDNNTACRPRTSNCISIRSRILTRRHVTGCHRCQSRQQKALRAAEALTRVIVNTAVAVLHVHKPRRLLSIRAVLYFEGKHSPDLLHKLRSFLLKVHKGLTYIRLKHHRIVKDQRQTIFLTKSGPDHGTIMTIGSMSVGEPHSFL